MPYIGLTPGQRVTVTIHAFIDEVLVNGVKVSYADGEQVELFTETDDVEIALADAPEPCGRGCSELVADAACPEHGVAAYLRAMRAALDAPAVVCDADDPNAPKDGA